MATPLSLKIAHDSAAPTHGREELFAWSASWNEGRMALFCVLTGGSASATAIPDALERLAQDIEEGANAPRGFERTLAVINAQLGGAPHSVPLAGVIGLAHGGRLFCSGVGSVRALFLQKTAPQRFSTYDLEAQFLRPPEESVSDTGPFTTVLDGDLHEGDVLYVATKIAEHALPADDLHTMLTTLPPAGALERIRQHVPPADGFAAVVVQVPEVRRSGAHKNSNPLAALSSLHTNQDRTRDVMGEPPTDVASSLRHAARTAARGLIVPGARGLGSVLRRGAGMLLRGGAFLLGQLITQGRSMVARIAREVRRRGWHTSRRVRRGILVAGVLVVALIAWWILAARAQTRAQAETALAQTISAIEQHLTQAEASIIYRNTEEARTELAAARGLLSTLPTDDSREQMTELSARLNELEAAARGELLARPRTIAHTDATLRVATTTESGRTYALDELGAWWRLDALEQTWATTDLTLTGGTALAATTEDAAVITLHEGGTLVQTDFTAARVAPAATAQSFTNPVDIVLYNNNLYVLTAGSAQIVKLVPQGEGFGGPTGWIATPAPELTNARAFTIDGDVYVVTGTTVLKFRRGARENFTPDATTFTLQNPVDLWTTADASALYILDRGAGRIIVLDKETGAVIAQYIGEEFRDGIALTVKENDRLATVVGVHDAWEFTLTHLLE